MGIAWPARRRAPPACVGQLHRALRMAVSERSRSRRGRQHPGLWKQSPMSPCPRPRWLRAGGSLRGRPGGKRFSPLSEKCPHHRCVGSGEDHAQVLIVVLSGGAQGAAAAGTRLIKENSSTTSRVRAFFAVLTSTSNKRCKVRSGSGRGFGRARQFDLQRPPGSATSRWLPVAPGRRRGRRLHLGLGRKRAATSAIETTS